MQQALLQLRCLPILFQQRVYKPLSRTKSASPQATIGHHKANYPIHQKIGARSTTKRLNSSVMISSPKPPNKNNKYHFKLHVAPFCQDNLSFFGGPKNVICESQAFGKWNPKTSPQWSSPKKRLEVGDRGHPWHKLSLLLQDKSMAHWETRSCHTRWKKSYTR